MCMMKRLMDDLDLKECRHGDREERILEEVSEFHHSVIFLIKP